MALNSCVREGRFIRTNLVEHSFGHPSSVWRSGDDFSHPTEGVLLEGIYSKTYVYDLGEVSELFRDAAHQL